MSEFLLVGGNQDKTPIFIDQRCHLRFAGYVLNLCLQLSKNAIGRAGRDHFLEECVRRYVWHGGQGDDGLN